VRRAGRRPAQNLGIAATQHKRDQFVAEYRIRSRYGLLTSEQSVQ
jgi:hypothetical protein